MGVKTALLLLVPSAPLAAYGFRWVPPAPHALRSSSGGSSNVDDGRSSEVVSRGVLSPSAAAVPGSGLRRRARRELVLLAGGEPDTHASAQNGVNPRQRVSRALNRALGNIVATGDMFGSVSKSVSDDNAFGRTFSSKIGHDDTAIVPVDEDEDHDDDEGEKEDEDEEEDEDGGDETQHARDVEDLFAGGNRLSTRKFGRQRRRKSSKNRLLRAKTEASAAVVVDGPFDKLEAYMTLPVSEYSLLDSSIIRRVSETSFRFQIPLKDFVGLDFTPTMEVEVELDSQAKAVVFRSVRSTLYGNVGRPGEEASTNPWPEAASSKVEFFRVAFDARLRWVDGDASKAPRQRGGRGGFGGEFARRPRPAPPRETPRPSGAGPRAEGSGGAASVGSVVGGGGGGAAGVGAGADGVLASPAVVEVGEVGLEADEELLERVGPATVFCDTEIKVQVLLPPPYNTLLPWRLVRVLLGKLLSTIVAYVLPRFLELLADDFYGWQSGSRRAAATAGETNRTLLGAKGSGSESTGRKRPTSVGAQQPGVVSEEGAVAAAADREGGRASRRGGGSTTVGDSRGGNESNRNPVVGGLQRLRHGRGSGGDRAGLRATAAGEVAAATTTPSSAATLQRTPRESSSSRGSDPEDRFHDWAAPLAPSGPASGKGFNFEVTVEDDADESGDDMRRQQRWRRGWRGGGDRGVEGDGGGGDGGSGGGGPINWWG